MTFAPVLWGSGVEIDGNTGTDRWRIDLPLLTSRAQGKPEDCVGQELQVKRIPPFPSRATVIAAANMLKAEGHAGFDAMRLEYDLQHTDAGTGAGLRDRATSLASYALNNPDARTPDGMSLQSAIVTRAGEIYRSGKIANIGNKERSAFKLASAQDGRLNDVTEFGAEVVTINDGGVVGRRPIAVPSDPQSSHSVKSKRPRRVFVVHGHDDAAREAVARFLERLEFEPIVLHEQANRGGTIIEKFEANSDVGYAVVLLTPDDEGSKTGSTASPRARQNVIFEWGYFVGRLGREHVFALKKGNVELPSDSQGWVWEVLDEHGAWRQKLAKELDAAGFSVDWSKVAP
ncbi:nucleotide-binding protein [Mesorhizobium sp. M2D.F.Ca.ET.233.01.1.1]|uniref:TIR domain-containing protein n=1 Tax=Mesorhizobium sp. M2D.F.Ca.ET.233.01.1.1 TaxID=2563943 RepID=UPI001FDEB40A|nr:nucleotide-binding protein [Mesorhizobium sp. M2D.F.Ca.ET.233.01.1.1]